MRRCVERVQAWIDARGGMPLINNLLLDDVDEDAARIRAEFWEPSSLGSADANEFIRLVPEHNPSDPAERFVVLNGLWMIKEDGKYAYLHPTDLDERQRSIDRYLRTAVDLLTPTDCQDSIHLRWEMIVAAELGLWSRVDALYQYWRSAWPSESVVAAQSAARLKLVPSIFDTSTDWVLYWWLEYPYDLPEPAKLGTQLLRELCAMVGGAPSKRLERSTPIVLNEHSLERVCEAADLLGRTERVTQALDVPSRFLHAWAHAVIGISTGATESFGRAAALYEPLLALVDPADDGSLTTRAHLLLTLVRLHAWAGSSQEALKWAEQLIVEAPNGPFNWEILAQLRRAVGDDGGWVQAYEEYVRRSSHLDSDWSATELLRLGLAQASGSDMTRMLEAVPQLRDDLDVTRSAVAWLWPQFDILAPAAQLRVGHAIAFLTNPRIVAAFGEARWAKAVVELGEGANEQLKASVIGPFSAWLREHRHFDSLRTQVRGGDDAKLVTALKFPDRITLGPVAALFDRGAMGLGVVAPLFRAWLDQNRPELRSALVDASKVLGRLRDARNPATHQSTADRVTAAQTYKDARQVFDMLFVDSSGNK